MPSINNFSGPEEYVSVAGEGHWRVSTRETAITCTHDEEIRQMVCDVIVPPRGPAFSTDVSRSSGRDFSDSHVNALVLTKAVNWLPSLAASSSAARGLLRDLRERVSAEDRERIDAVLAVEPDLEAEIRIRRERERANANW